MIRNHWSGLITNDYADIIGLLETIDIITTNMITGWLIIIIDYHIILIDY